MSRRLHLPALLRLLSLSAALTAGAAHADAYSDMSALIQSGNTAQALQQAQTYLAANPRDPQMRFLQGAAQSQAGDTAAAVETFTQLVQEYPELPEPYNNLAVIYAAQGDLDKARGALEQAVRNNPNYAVAHENLGDIYARLAHKAYQRAHQLGSATQRLELKLGTLHQLLQPAAK